MMKECPRCEGTGDIIIIEDPENGVMDEYYYECPNCEGSGEVKKTIFDKIKGCFVNVKNKI